MIYVATTSSPAARQAMADGLIAGMVTPGGGSNPPPGSAWCADNGKFGKNWVSHDRWWTWLIAKVAANGAGTCMFAVAPDVVGDAAATLVESLPWLSRIRELGVPVAFVAQNGCEADGMIPWGQFDVLFIGGDDAFKLGPTVPPLIAEAKRGGYRVHMGRVNSRRRVQYATAIGCDSVDGTYVAFGPDVNLPKMMSWVSEVRRQPLLFGWDD